MLKTKIKKVFAIIALTSLVFSGAHATQIGTGTVVGSGAFDTIINWDDNFPGTASGSVTNILIKARVNPVLNMSISAEEIDLGVLAAGVTSTGGLDIEVGTNAVSGVTITARSQDAGLTNVADGTVQINSLATDEVVESYTWASSVNAADDSSFASFAATGLSALEIIDNSTEHTVYSTNKPESTTAVDDLTFVVAAQTTAETPAGDYEDRVTFTVTGNF
jgi:hypothetical protein